MLTAALLLLYFGGRARAHRITALVDDVGELINVRDI